MKNIKQIQEEVYMREAANRSLARIHDHVKNRNVGLISADRAEHTAEERKAHRKALKADIRKHGYGYVNVQGRYIENKGTPHEKTVDDEHSFMVIGKKGDDKGALKGFLKKHGEKYNQDSVLHKAHNEPTAKLHGTTKKKDAWVPYGKTHDVGEFHPNKAAEYHSKLKGNRPFSFTNEDYEIKFTVDPNKYSQKETLF